MIKVMVVDDDAPLREMLSKYLSRQGYLVSCAANGPEALAWVEQAGLPHLILMDVNMPGMNGLEVLQQLKEKDNKIKVIMMSGSGIPGIRGQAQALGAVAFLPKPFPFQQLKECIEQIGNSVEL
jgi:CheY-like chemotaxis protein